ncbi:MAG: glycerol-3-phosphate dehydrogenase [Candidatus Puniceispirillaceae bacterium]
MTDGYDTDILIIGGGINGVGIARDAAGRGLRVTLCEKGDLAGATSSASTKLIHGGLRYLEHYEFGLVRAALMEREVLMAAARHIISPLRFILPHSPGVRPAWLIRLGLFLYDHLGGRETLPASGSVDLKESRYGASLQPDITSGAYYYDCWVDDARLVVLNALDARERGANILTRTECLKAGPQPEGSGWVVTLKDHCTGRSRQLTAGMVVNAAGPWASRCLETVIEEVQTHPARLVRGSHVVVPKLFDHDNAYIFQNPDGRIVFAIPYESDYSLIGTTDDDFQGDLDTIGASTHELDYICETANRFFTQQISRDDIIWSYAGVRPLLGGEGDAKKVSRDYRLDVQQTASGATALSVLGGKITTYRKLAEQATDRIMELMGRSTGAWTARVSLPGGDIEDSNLDDFIASVEAKYTFLDSALLNRYALSYGTRMKTMLDGVRSEACLGVELCPGLYECEANYLVQHEWARTAEDILWRRTKLGLKATSDDVASLERWVDRRAA